MNTCSTRLHSEAQVNEVQQQTQTKIDVDFDTDPCKCYIKALGFNRVASKWEDGD